MYSYYNPSPYGKNVGDCTVRAISKATGKDWGETYLALAIQGYLDGDMPSANATWGAFFFFSVSMKEIFRSDAKKSCNSLYIFHFWARFPCVPIGIRCRS